MRRIGTLNPYPRPRERQGSGNRLPIRLGRQPRPCRHRSVRRQTDQLPVLRQRPPAPNQPRRRSHHRHRTRQAAPRNLPHTG